MRLTAAVKMRMVKPVDGDWDAAGSRLRELASIAHRVLNRTVAMLAVRDDAPGFEAPREWRSSGGKVQAYNCAAVAIEAVNRDRLTIRWSVGHRVRARALSLARGALPESQSVVGWSSGAGGRTR